MISQVISRPADTMSDMAICSSARLSTQRCSRKHELHHFGQLWQTRSRPAARSESQPADSVLKSLSQASRFKILPPQLLLMNSIHQQPPSPCLTAPSMMAKSARISSWIEAQGRRCHSLRRLSSRNRTQTSWAPWADGDDLGPLTGRPATSLPFHAGRPGGPLAGRGHGSE
jgi:hypothetical protein